MKKSKGSDIKNDMESSGGLPDSLNVIETLEPRIMLSATWVDADIGDPIDGPTEGNDIFTADGNVDDIVDALGGDDGRAACEQQAANQVGGPDLYALEVNASALFHAEGNAVAQENGGLHGEDTAEQDGFPGGGLF